MSIRNLRIGLRASLCFAVLASLLVVVGLFGLGQMKTLRESAAVIEESWMPSIESIHDAAANIASIRLESLRLITSTQAAVRERSKGLLTAQRQELLKRLDDHKALIANDQERTMLEGLSADTAKYLSILDQIIKQLDAGQNEQAYARLGSELAPQGTVLDKTLEQSTDHWRHRLAPRREDCQTCQRAAVKRLAQRTRMAANRTDHALDVCVLPR